MSDEAFHAPGTPRTLGLSYCNGTRKLLYENQTSLCVGDALIVCVHLSGLADPRE